MKYLLLLLVIGIAAWMIMARRRTPPPDDTPAPKKPTAAEPAAMLACAHCGVHLPLSEATTDAAGKAYCTEAHRLAGPR